MATSLNDIKQQLIGFFNNHAQINDVRYEDGFDFAAETSLNYPVANIEYVDTVYNGKMASHQFEITLGDLDDENVPGIEDEIFSDLNEIADDFASWLWEQPQFEFDRRMQIRKFVEKNGDRVVGLTAVINLNAVLRGNPCQTPTKD